MSSLLVALALAATPARLHLVDASSCGPTPGLAEAFALRLPGVVLAPAGEAPGPEDRVVRLVARGAAHGLTVESARGEAELSRELPAACETLADFAATIVERHFEAVPWAGLGAALQLPPPPTPAPAAPVVSPPPAVVAPPPPAATASRWSLRALVGLGYGADGTLALPRLGLDVSLDTERFAFGVLGGTSFEQRTPVTVEGRERGEVRSRVDDVYGTGAVCLGAGRLRGCAGVVAGVLLLTGEAKGSLSQLDGVTLAAFAAGGTLHVTLDLTEHFFLGARGLGVAPVTPLTLAVEGADRQRTLSFQALGSLGLGWKFF